MNIGVSEIIPFSQHDADLLERSFDMALPADVRDFFNKYNGGKLQLNEVKGFAREPLQNSQQPVALAH